MKRRTACFGLARPTLQRAAQQPQALAHGAAAVAYPSDGGRDGPADLTRGGRQPAHRVPAQPGIGRKADIGLDDGRVHPHGPRSQPPFAARLNDQVADQCVHDPRTQAPGELAHRRFVRRTLVQRQQTEAAQMQRVRDLPHQRLVPPASAVLDDQQPHVDRHRQRRPAPIAGRDVPMLMERLEHRGVGQQRVESTQSSGKAMASGGSKLPRSVATGCEGVSRSMAASGGAW